MPSSTYFNVRGQQIAPFGIVYRKTLNFPGGAPTPVAAAPVFCAPRAFCTTSRTSHALGIRSSRPSWRAAPGTMHPDSAETRVIRHVRQVRASAVKRGMEGYDAETDGQRPHRCR